MSSPSHKSAGGAVGAGSFLSQLKKFDIYRSVSATRRRQRGTSITEGATQLRPFVFLPHYAHCVQVPRDLTEQTPAGAAISLLSGLLVLILVLSEFASYLRVDVRHEMFVEHPGMRPVHSTVLGPEFPDDGLLQLNFNVTLPRMPCAIVSVTVQDILGGVIDSHSQLIQRYRTDHSGTLLRSMAPPFQPLSGDHATTVEQQLHEGCNVEGHVRVPRVPGQLQISSSAHIDVLQRFLQQQQRNPAVGGGISSQPPPPPTLNTSHIIHELWFGETLALTEVSNAAVAPLNGGSKWSLHIEGDHGEGSERSFEYFLKVIPTQYQRLTGPPIPSYQYVSSSNELIGRTRIPSIYFRYDVEPVTVRFVAKREAFSHFLVNLCAIVGGAVAVMGLANMAVKQLERMNAPKSGAGGKSSSFNSR